MKHSSTSRKRILIVEDEPAIRQVCQRVLIDEGFDVDIAANGLLAQDMLSKKEYDLCLIDIRTPIINGRELYQHMKEKHPELTNKVIFTTGATLNNKLDAFFREAGRPYLLKPFTPDELRAIVRQALE